MICTSIKEWFAEKRGMRKEKRFVVADRITKKMKGLVIERKVYTDNSTIGELFFDGEFVCYTLEDTVRAVKKYGETAIWSGKYEVVINYSNRFKKYLPLLLNVPAYKGIRIHTGNFPTHTLGCILVGEIKGDDYVGRSRDAFDTLMSKLTPAMRVRKIFIEIVGGYKYEENKKVA